MELLSLKHLEPRFLNTSLNCKFSKPPYPVLPRICRHHGTFKSETSRAQVLEYLNCVKLLGNHSGYQLSQTRSCCRSSPQPCSASSQSRDNRHGYDDHRVAEVLINRLMTEPIKKLSDQENLRSQILQVELSLINYRNVC